MVSAACVTGVWFDSGFVSYLGIVEAKYAVVHTSILLKLPNIPLLTMYGSLRWLTDFNRNTITNSRNVVALKVMPTTLSVDCAGLC